MHSNDVGFEEIANNCDIAIYLYQFLNFSDQLRLSRVNRQLQNIFEQLIWKEKYQVMTITEDEDANYVVMAADVGTTSPLILEHDEFQEFMDCYAGNVEQLCVKNLHIIEINDIVKWEFRKLLKLQYERIQMPMTHLTLLGRKCPNLEELEFLRCSMCPNLNVVIGKKMPSIKSLAKIRKLRRLSIENSRSGQITYKTFEQTVRRLHLEQFKLNDFITTGGDETKKQKSTKTSKATKLRELDVEICLNPEQWPAEVYTSLLSNLRNLQILTLYCSQRVEGINEAALLAISKTCHDLKIMKIIHSYFQNIQTFHLPANLKELSLEYCRNLNCENFKQLLGEIKCSKFQSKSIVYEGQLDEFEISPFVEILDVDYVATRKLRSHTLKELSWYDDDIKTGSPTETYLDSCKTLEKLYIKSGILSLSTIFNLENLQTLSINESMPKFNWSYFMALLKHPTLKNLSLEGQRYRSLLCEHSEVPAEGFVTKLQNLKISLPTFRNALEFWLDLFERNVQLTLTCNHFIHFEEFLRLLLDHEDFPSNLRTIEIWDISLNCNKLRRNFDYMMNKFMYDVSFIRSEYQSDGDLYCIRFQR